MDEASRYSSNCFVTLTYDEDHLPLDRSVSRREVQLFMKRLRKAISPLRVRFFACGEYGERFGRPHLACYMIRTITQICPSLIITKDLRNRSLRIQFRSHYRLFTNMRKNRIIKSYRLGEFGEGDAGVTIAEFKD